ncbi:ATP-binding cassette domain-containing protein [Aestuariivita sp.]|jgi:tungstate transport system ATP-binding protein|uniref:ATP-binding cassette domain-containing protein n=1 Tax=Aestuariivita sp. TaxID=1872407 RepID=UPI0025BCA3D0|nr:ATP-binding cassette domain-containing protein [Aestuariivita sp.]
MREVATLRTVLSQNVIDAAIAPPLMTARGLGCSIKGQRLVRDVDLTIRQGRRTVVLGPNGAGKSVLLRLLHGLLPASEGTVLWRGNPLGADAQDGQAMVFQRPVMLRRSVLANLNFALKVRGFRGPERARRAAQALEMAGLDHLAKRPARVLSGGEQQRLAIARALATGPDLLLLDEPTASLDPAATARIEALIGQAHASGVTIVMVTHDRGQAQRLADDVVFLQDGRLAESGPASTLLHSPRSDAVRAWLDGRLFVTTPQTQP